MGWRCFLPTYPHDDRCRHAGGHASSSQHGRPFSHRHGSASPDVAHGPLPIDRQCNSPVIAILLFASARCLDDVIRLRKAVLFFVFFFSFFFFFSTSAAFESKFERPGGGERLLTIV